MAVENPLADRLESLLRYEAALLRAGDFGELGRIAEEKAILIDRVAAEGQGGDGARIAALRELAARNLGLISSAIGGIRAARRHVEQLRRATTSLDTYDSLGRLRTVPLGRAGVEHKA